MFNKGEKFCCYLTSLISGFLTSAGIAAIFYVEAITSISILLYISLIIGILTLFVILFLNLCNKRELRNTYLISTSIGSIITSAFALAATTLQTASISVAILIGAVSFFLTINLIYIVKAFIYRLCEKNCN